MSVGGLRTGMRDRCIAGMVTDGALWLLLSLLSSNAPRGSGSASIGTSVSLCAGVLAPGTERLLRRWFMIVLAGSGASIFRWSGAHQTDTRILSVERLLLRRLESTFVMSTASSSWSSLSPFQ